MLRGSVLTDTLEQPIRGAEVYIPQLRLSTMSDSTGSFTLPNIPRGRQLVMVRRVGYRPISQAFDFAAGAVVEADFLLLRTPQTLPQVEVKEANVPRRLVEFEERRHQGFGYFLTTADLDKAEGRALSDVLNSVPALRIYRSTVSSSAWSVSARGQEATGGGTFSPDQSDVSRGAPTGMCYTAVFLDGNPIFTGRTGQMLFDLNTLDPKIIAGIEVYGGNSTLPPQFQRGGNSCGALLIWTR